MNERSYESEWLDYVAENRRAKEAYRRTTERLHRAYTEQVARDVHRAALAGAAR